MGAPAISRTDTAIRVISASPDLVFAALPEIVESLEIRTIPIA